MRTFAISVKDLIVLWTCLVLLSVSCVRQNSQELTIATAANMQFAMQELIGEFTKKTGIECNMVVSSSGKL
ncbi:MAG TPA: molybdate ABC transporter substrate-binding protein, partial [Pricia sp.]|nr:molybdate ABC transporter substrate-binding protein [Pricia sp.]